MEWALDGGTEYILGRSRLWDENIVYRNGEPYDLRGDLFVIIRNLAVNIDTYTKKYKDEDYIFRKHEITNILKDKLNLE